MIRQLYYENVQHPYYPTSLQPLNHPDITSNPPVHNLHNSEQEQVAYKQSELRQSFSTTPSSNYTPTFFTEATPNIHPNAITLKPPLTSSPPATQSVSQPTPLQSFSPYLYSHYVTPSYVPNSAYITSTSTSTSSASSSPHMMQQVIPLPMYPIYVDSSISNQGKHYSNQSQYQK